MSFTYFGNLSTNLDKVRFYIGDKVEDTGVQPDGTNFTDEEIEGVLATEGSWQRAVAGIFETLALMYSPQVDFKLGPRAESRSQRSEAYAAQGATWRKKFGTGARATGRALTRTDGYSDDLKAGNVS